MCSGLTSVATNRDTESGINYIGPLYKMATLTRHTDNHLTAQLCSDVTSVATNRDTESGINYYYYYYWYSALGPVWAETRFQSGD